MRQVNSPLDVVRGDTVWVLHWRTGKTLRSFEVLGVSLAASGLKYSAVNGIDTERVECTVFHSISSSGTDYWEDAVGTRVSIYALGSTLPEIRDGVLKEIQDEAWVDALLAVVS